jgi:hypothetical protein
MLTAQAPRSTVSKLGAWPTGLTGRGCSQGYVFKDDGKGTLAHVGQWENTEVEVSTAIWWPTEIAALVYVLAVAFLTRGRNYKMVRWSRGRGGCTSANQTLPRTCRLRPPLSRRSRLRSATARGSRQPDR